MNFSSASDDDKKIIDNLKRCFLAENILSECKNLAVNMLSVTDAYTANLLKEMFMVKIYSITAQLNSIYNIEEAKIYLDKIWNIRNKQIGHFDIKDANYKIRTELLINNQKNIKFIYTTVSCNIHDLSNSFLKFYGFWAIGLRNEINKLSQQVNEIIRNNPKYVLAEEFKEHFESQEENLNYLIEQNMFTKIEFI